MADITEYIQHYRKRLAVETSTEKILYILSKLKRCHITTRVLQDTGIGKTVNTLCKEQGEIGAKASDIVAKWRKVVSKEEEDDKKKDSPQSPEVNHVKEEEDEEFDPVEALVNYSNKTKGPSSKHSHSHEKNHHKEKSVDKNNHKSETPSAPSSGKKRANPEVEKRKLKKVKKIMEASTDGLDSSMGFSFGDLLSFDESKVSKKRLSPVPKSRPNPIPMMSEPGPSTSSISGNHSKTPNNHKNKDKSSSKNHHNSSSSKSSNNRPNKKSDHKKKERTCDIKLDAKIKSEIEVDLSSLLPAIQPNYKPLRLPSMPDEPPAIPKPSTAAYLPHVDPGQYMNSRHSRTQVFSGRKSYSLVKVPTLFDLCTRCLQDNIYSLEYTGGIPYSLLKNVLQKCTPQELLHVESYNSNLVEDLESDELWMTHCQRDFKGKNPSDEYETWRELYFRLSNEREQRFQNVRANITKNMRQAVPVRKVLLATDDYVKPPRNIARAQAKYGTAVGCKPKAPKSESKAAILKSSRPNLGPSAAESNSVIKEKVQPKKVAPLMQKALKLVKNRFRR